MKIKAYLNNVIAVIAVVALVSGFQLDNATENNTVLDSMLGIEEAYAGPCNDNGCVGGSDKCMEVNILLGAFKRTCYTTVESGNGSPQIEESIEN